MIDFGLVALDDNRKNSVAKTRVLNAQIYQLFIAQGFVGAGNGSKPIPAIKVGRFGTYQHDYIPLSKVKIQAQFKLESLISGCKIIR